MVAGAAVKKTYRNCLKARTILRNWYAWALSNLWFISSGKSVTDESYTTSVDRVTVRVSFSQLSLALRTGPQSTRQTKCRGITYHWLNMDQTIRVMIAHFCIILPFDYVQSLIIMVKKPRISIKKVNQNV